MLRDLLLLWMEAGIDTLFKPFSFSGGLGKRTLLWFSFEGVLYKRTSSRISFAGVLCKRVSDCTSFARMFCRQILSNFRFTYDPCFQLRPYFDCFSINYGINS